jgi:MFS family permease
VCIRFVGGSFAIATTALPIAYSVDVSTEESRSKNLSMLAAAVTLGASLGYFLGGVVGIASVETAFWVQILMLLGCIGAMYMLLGESKAPGAALSAEKTEKKRSAYSKTTKSPSPSFSPPHKNSPQAWTLAMCEI